MTAMDDEAFHEDSRYALSRFADTTRHLQNILEMASHELRADKRKLALVMLADCVQEARKIHAQMAAILSNETLIQQRQEAGQ
jgi:hypothetical protein